MTTAGAGLLFQDQGGLVAGDRLLQAMGNDARILVTSLTRHAVKAVRLSDRAAILTPINMSTAQEIAFRPVNFVEARAPLVLDFASAFHGFRHVRHGLENLPDPNLRRTSYD